MWKAGMFVAEKKKKKKASEELGILPFFTVVQDISFR